MTFNSYNFKFNIMKITKITLKYCSVFFVFALLMAVNFVNFENKQKGNLALYSITQASASWDEWGNPIYDTPVTTCCNCPPECKGLECIKNCCPLKIEGTCSKTCN